MKTLIKRMVPCFIRKKIGLKWQALKLNKTAAIRNKKVAEKICKKLKTGEKINLCFFESRAQIWFFDELYKLFRSDSRFDVKVIITPFTANGIDGITQNMNQLYDLLEEKGIKAIKSFDEKSGEYIDVKEKFNPDIIFFTENWHGLCNIPQFFMERFDNSWNYYCFYAIPLPINPSIYNMAPNYLAKADFLLSSQLLNEAKKSRGDSAINCFVSGHPKLDVYFNKSFFPNNPWKKQEKLKKKIIWAPHFSFGDNTENPAYVVGSFYEIYDYMLELVDEYKDSVQFCFKPHPMLRTFLGKHWSKEKIDDYYETWGRLPNTQFENGNYIDLFLTSDAMIFDSISFIVEYLCTLKPSLYTVCKDAKLAFNNFGMAAYNQIYHTENIKEDIKKFIDDVVLEQKDTMLLKRKTFVEKEIRPKNEISASRNMYNKVINDMGLQT